MTIEYKQKLEKQPQQNVADKFDTGKLRYDLIPGYPIEELAKVYTYGVQKYTIDNYLKGMEWRKIIGAIFRHLWQWTRGQVIDEESGCHHLAHVLWNICTLMVYENENIGIDDRNPYLLDKLPLERRTYLLKKWESTVKGRVTRNDN